MKVCSPVVARSRGVFLTTFSEIRMVKLISPNSSIIVCCDLNNKNTIKVESAEVIIDILLEDNTTRNGKSPNKTFLLEQNHQPVCTIYNEQVDINITFCSKCHCETHYKWSLLPSY